MEPAGAFQWPGQLAALSQCGACPTLACEVHLRAPLTMRCPCQLGVHTCVSSHLAEAPFVGVTMATENQAFLHRRCKASAQWRMVSTVLAASQLQVAWHAGATAQTATFPWPRGVTRSRLLLGATKAALFLPLAGSPAGARMAPASRHRHSLLHHDRWPLRRAAPFLARYRSRA